MAGIAWKTMAQVNEENKQKIMAARFTFKTDIWMRCTDDEAERLDGALQTTNVRQRRMWDDCQKLEHTSELFTLLHEQMTASFGATRADQLLAPSNEVAP